MWNILSFEIVQNTKGLFLVRPLGGFFLAFQLGLIEFGLYLLVFHLSLEESVVVTHTNLKSTLSILDSLCKNITPNIRIITEENISWHKHLNNSRPYTFILQKLKKPIDWFVLIYYFLQ